ncbi:MAG: transporter substrate-binding domain-containing protein [Deltaproteobacteria bacterium]|nr:transporter substrate-binding domain-containing protein [Deltaproteobacteria bacterium]
MRRTTILLAILLVSSCKEPPPPPLPVDPRIDVAGAPAPPPVAPFGGPVVEPPPPESAQERFALALTGHRRKTYVSDLPDLRTRGVLRVLTRNNSTSYFLYKGVEAGVDYELAQWIAEEMGVRLEMVVAPTQRELVPWLLDGRGDVIIAGLSTAAARADRVHFTRPYIETPWVVVVKKPPAKKGKAKGKANDEPPALTSLPELAGKDVVVKPSSGAMKRLRGLEIPGLVPRAAKETEESEDLLDEVGEGKAFACVIEERIAKVELLHRDDLHIALALPGGDDQAALAVRQEDAQLHEFLEKFLEQNYKSTRWNLMWRRYHSWKDETRAVRNDELRADREGRITPWDEMFRAVGKEHEVDWRLIAAQCYQESRFDVGARSAFGAIGIMQFLPSTAKELGCSDPTEPRAAITCAGRFVGKLVKRYTEDSVALKDRVRFALAAYNAGPGHLDDARVLAKAQGLDGNRWFGNVETAMLLLSKPRYYETARHGFARGEETVRYVSEIQTRYDAYVGLAQP